MERWCRRISRSGRRREARGRDVFCEATSAKLPLVESNRSDGYDAIVRDGDSERAHAHVLGRQEWLSEFLPPSGHAGLLPLTLRSGVLLAHRSSFRVGPVGAMVP